MSIFKSESVILKQKRNLEQDFIYTIFTKDFWKILVNKKFSKKEKKLDIGFLINCEIIVKEEKNIHKIRNIKIKWDFLSKKRCFEEINYYLELLSFIDKNIAFWISIPEIYEIMKEINSIKNCNKTKLILAKLKIKNIIWELDLSHKNKTIEKILKFINQNNIKKILKLNWINKELEKELEKI